MDPQAPKEPLDEQIAKEELNDINNAWNDIGVGARRAIIVAFVLTWILWYFLSSEMIWDGYHDKDERRIAMIVFPFAYWALVFAGIWIYRGFKK